MSSPSTPGLSTSLNESQGVDQSSSRSLQSSGEEGLRLSFHGRCLRWPFGAHRGRVVAGDHSASHSLVHILSGAPRDHPPLVGEPRETPPDSPDPTFRPVRLPSLGRGPPTSDPDDTPPVRTGRPTCPSRPRQQSQTPFLSCSVVSGCRFQDNL